MTALATHGQVRAIHALKARVGLDETAYREALGLFGVGSSKDLSKADAGRFIDRLKGHVPVGSMPGARGALRLDGPYAGVCRALWLSAWNLGLVADRRDTALTAFVARQTGIDSINWVRDAQDGMKAIEGLKAWISREAGIAWPTEAQAKKLRLTLAAARKRAVIAAQQRMLGCADGIADVDLDEVMNGFGRVIRAAKSKREERD